MQAKSSRKSLSKEPHGQSMNKTPSTVSTTMTSKKKQQSISQSNSVQNCIFC